MAFDIYLNIVLQVWLIFIALECFILSREASRFAYILSFKSGLLSEFR